MDFTADVVRGVEIAERTKKKHLLKLIVKYVKGYFPATNKHQN